MVVYSFYIFDRHSKLLVHTPLPPFAFIPQKQAEEGKRNVSIRGCGQDKTDQDRPGGRLPDQFLLRIMLSTAPPRTLGLQELVLRG